MRQAQPLLKPGAVVPAERLHPHPGVGTADDGGQGQEQNGRERVPARIGAAGIRHAFQTAPQERARQGAMGTSRASIGSLAPRQTVSQRNLAIVLGVAEFLNLPVACTIMVGQSVVAQKEESCP